MRTNPRYGPWIVKQRPTGDWVCDQVDHQEGKIRRYGPYATKAQAQQKRDDIAVSKP